MSEKINISRLIEKEKYKVNIFVASKYIRTILNDFHKLNERDLTKKFLLKTAEHYRIKHFSLNQTDEKKLNADWYWCIITDNGIYEFVVKAKKIYTKPTKSTIKCKNGRQIKRLIHLGHTINAVPLYVFYSKDIKRSQCQWMNKKTPEGVFFSPAERVVEYASNPNQPLVILPISCMFTCFSRICHYSSNKKEQHCIICNKCKNKECHTKDKHEISNTPFEKVFFKIFGINCTPSPQSDKLLLAISAESVLRKNHEFIEFCFNHMEEKLKTINNIIITDYTNKHKGDYISSLLGIDYIKDENNILSLEYIKKVLSEKWSKYPMFKNIGIFGSYTKENKATPKSDVDIMLEYDLNIINFEEDLDNIIKFLKEVAFSLKKPVDFVDYISARAKNDFFYNEVKNNIQWIDLPKKP